MHSSDLLNYEDEDLETRKKTRAKGRLSGKRGLRLKSGPQLTGRRKPLNPEDKQILLRVKRIVERLRVDPAPLSDLLLMAAINDKTNRDINHGVLLSIIRHNFSNYDSCRRELEDYDLGRFGVILKIAVTYKSMEIWEDLQEAGANVIKAAITNQKKEGDYRIYRMIRYNEDGSVNWRIWES